MLKIALRGLLARKLRGSLTAIAIVMGVGMVAGTLMLSDSVNSSFDDIFATANEGVDVAVRPNIEVEPGFDGTPVGTAIGEQVLERVGEVEGAEQVAGQIGDISISILDEDGERIGPPQGGPPHIANSVDPEPFDPFTYTQGRAPEAADEVAIDSITADEEGYEAGQSVDISGVSGVASYEISGIARFGTGVPLAGASLAVFTLPEAQRLTGKVGHFDQISVAAADGVEPEQLQEAIARAIGDEFDVKTGEQIAADDSADLQEGFGFLTTALLAFAGIALFVGAFLIFNTFSITVEQRTREFGMLRTIGASRGQIHRGVLAEATILGLVASVIGVGAGIAFVEMITRIFSAMGFELPSAGLIVKPPTIVIPIAIGLLTTVVSATIPARRATRVTPIDAMREGVAEQGPARGRTTLGAILIAAGVAVIGLGLFATDDIGAALGLLALGLIGLFIGLGVVASRVLGPIARAVGWPFARFGGTSGRLAGENVLRNPGRTATTAAALTVGVALVVFATTFAASINRSIDDAIDRAFAGDVLVFNTDGFSPIPSGVGPEIEQIDGVAASVGFAGVTARLETPVSEELLVQGTDPATLTQVVNLDWVDGSDSELLRLGHGGIVVEAGFAEDEGIEVGDQLEVTAPDGGLYSYEVAGTIDDQVGLVADPLLVSLEEMRERFDAISQGVVLVSFDQGADFEAVRMRIDERLAASFPQAESRSQQQFKDENRDSINQLLTLIYALLALSVGVSLVGVVTTMVLTVRERTRELGMLRAVGTSRRQIRRLIRYESVITAMIGSIVGAVIGLGLGAAAVTALESEGLILDLPLSGTLVILVLAAFAGVVAAVIPARRASRINVIEALHYE